MLWENLRTTWPGRARRALQAARRMRRLVPELTAAPLPASQIHREKMVSLDVSVVASDVHLFTELMGCAAPTGSLAPLR